MTTTYRSGDRRKSLRAGKMKKHQAGFERVTYHFTDRNLVNYATLFCQSKCSKYLYFYHEN